MRKSVILGSSIALAASLLLAPASALTINNDYTSVIKIVDDKEEIVLTSENKQLVTDFLKDNELKPENYRNLDFSEISKSDYTEKNEIHTIYRLTSEISTTEVTLPIPEVIEESSDLLIGETRVKDDGAKGTAVKTIITETINGKNKVEEKITITQAPQPKIIHKGVKEEPVIVSNVRGSETYTGTENTRIGENTPILEPTTSRANTVNRVPRPAGVTNQYHNYDLNLLPEYESKLMNDVKSMVGKPYVWGNHNPNIGFDCSGLVYWAFRNNGFNIPRMTDDQGAYGSRVSMDDLQVGDLLVQYRHIGIYAGNGYVIHAANPSIGVTITPLHMFVDTKETYASRVL